MKDSDKRFRDVEPLEKKFLTKKRKKTHALNQKDERIGRKKIHAEVCHSIVTYRFLPSVYLGQRLWMTEKRFTCRLKRCWWCFFFSYCFCCLSKRSSSTKFSLVFIDQWRWSRKISTSWFTYIITVLSFHIIFMISIQSRSNEREKEKITMKKFRYFYLLLLLLVLIMVSITGLLSVINGEHRFDIPLLIAILQVFVGFFFYEINDKRTF